MYLPAMVMGLAQMVTGLAHKQMLMGQAYEQMLMSQVHEHMLMGLAHEQMLIGLAHEHLLRAMGPAHDHQRYVRIPTGYFPKSGWLAISWYPDLAK